MKFYIKLILTLIIIAVIGVGVLYFMSQRKAPDVPSVVQTTNAIDEIKKLNELSTLYYYDEKLITIQKQKSSTTQAAASIVNSITDFFKSDKSEKTISTTNDLSVICKVTLRLGYKLEEVFDSTHFAVSNDTVYLKLPEAQILDTILNPTDCTIFAEKGNWNLDELKTVISKAKMEAVIDAKNNDIYKKAGESGKKALEKLFSTVGYKVDFEDIKNIERPSLQ